jgi:hypothetical protein
MPMAASGGYRLVGRTCAKIGGSPFAAFSSRPRHRATAVRQELRTFRQRVQRAPAARGLHFAKINPEAVMAAIKVHLEQAELDPVVRFAESLNVKPEVVLYAALHRLMLESRNPAIHAEIIEVWEYHRDNLPLWSDSACSPHAYEGKGDDEPEPSRLLR